MAPDVKVTVTAADDDGMDSVVEVALDEYGLSVGVDGWVAMLGRAQAEMVATALVTLALELPAEEQL